MLPTDTQKNTVFAFAGTDRGGRDRGVRARPGPALRRRRGPGDRARTVRIEEYAWQRHPQRASPDGHDHAFAGPAGRSARRRRRSAPDGAHVVSGLKDLVVLKSTGSEFRGLPRRRATPRCPRPTTGSWPPRSTARWRHADGPPAGSTGPTSYAGIRSALLRALRRRALAARCSSPCRRWAGRCSRRIPEVDSIELVAAEHAPRRRSTSAPFGLDNPGEVFHVDGPALRADRGHRRSGTRRD